MAKEKKNILLMIQTFLCLSIALILAFMALDIYREGMIEKQNDPLFSIYSVEKIMNAVRPAAFLLILSVIVTVICFVLGIKGTEKPDNDVELICSYMRERVAVPDEIMKKERKIQSLLYFGGWAGFAVCMIPVVIYMTDSSHFMNGDINSEVYALVLNTAPRIIAAIAALYVSLALREKSVLREFDAVKKCIRDGKKECAVSEFPSHKALNVIRISIFVIAVIFIILGILNGSMSAVVNKAIRICTECIGLG